MTTHFIRIGCEAIVRNDAGEILLWLRTNCSGAGTWWLPWGHLEYGEKCSSAVVRELHEELWITVQHKDLELLAVVDDIEAEQHYIHLTFDVRAYTGEITIAEPDKCAERRFFVLGDLPDAIAPFHKKILDTIATGKIYQSDVAWQ